MLLSTEVVMSTIRLSVRFSRRLPTGFLLVVLALSAIAPLGRAQNSPQPPPTAPPQPETAPDAGGPGADPGTIAVPKKKDKADEPPPPAPVAPKIKNPEGAPSNYSLRIDVPEVTVDVGVVLEKTGTFVPGL